MSAEQQRDEALEVLRRIVVDHGHLCDPWKDPCACSIAQAKRLVEDAGLLP